MCYILWVCVSGFKLSSMQSARAMLYCRLWPVWPYLKLPHYVINGTISGKKVTEHKMCVLIFSTSLSEIFLVLRMIERDIINNVYSASCKEPVILVRFWWHPNFLDRISKSAQIPNFCENPSYGSRVPCGRTDTQTWN